MQNFIFTYTVKIVRDMRKFVANHRTFKIISGVTRCMR